MTSLVAWVGVDQRGPASIYIATDSRISWGAGNYWDFGRKVFACKNYPDIFGYVGDVLFPSLILSQITNSIDENLLFDYVCSPDKKFKKIKYIIKESFKSLPENQKRPFKIAYITRLNREMRCVFYFFSLELDANLNWKENQGVIPKKSDAIAIWGSGRKSVIQWKKRWDDSKQGSTSRAIFSSLCDSITNGTDQLSGGAPQLVCLYRIGMGKPIGVISNSKPYLFGVLVAPSKNHSELTEWRNYKFERCKINGQILKNAKKHQIPNGLGSKF